MHTACVCAHLTKCWQRAVLSHAHACILNCLCRSMQLHVSAQHVRHHLKLVCYDHAKHYSQQPWHGAAQLQLPMQLVRRTSEFKYHAASVSQWYVAPLLSLRLMDGSLGFVFIVNQPDAVGGPSTAAAARPWQAAGYARRYGRTPAERLTLSLYASPAGCLQGEVALRPKACISSRQ